MSFAHDSVGTGDEDLMMKAASESEMDMSSPFDVPAFLRRQES
jgi:hypothetical protein